jgi:hypothetical protein
LGQIATLGLLVWISGVAGGEQLAAYILLALGASVTLKYVFGTMKSGTREGRSYLGRGRNAHRLVKLAPEQRFSRPGQENSKVGVRVGII